MLCSPVAKKFRKLIFVYIMTDAKLRAAAKSRAEDRFPHKARIFRQSALKQHSKISEKSIHCEKQTKIATKDCAISQRQVLWKPVDKKLGQC